MASGINPRNLTNMWGVHASFAQRLEEELPVVLRTSATVERAREDHPLAWIQGDLSTNPMIKGEGE